MDGRMDQWMLRHPLISPCLCLSVRSWSPVSCVVTTRKTGLNWPRWQRLGKPHASNKTLTVRRMHTDWLLCSYYTYIHRLQLCGFWRCKTKNLSLCSGVRSGRTGAEPVLSSWDGRERHGTGLWTGTQAHRYICHKRTVYSTLRILSYHIIQAHLV